MLYFKIYTVIGLIFRFFYCIYIYFTDKELRKTSLPWAFLVVTFFVTLLWLAIVITSLFNVIKKTLSKK